MARARARGEVVSTRLRESDWRALAPGKSSVDEHFEEGEWGPDVSDEEVNIVVVHIRRLARSASLEFALRVGAVIIHHFYGGRVDTWRSRGPKTASFRKLSRHPALPLSAGALYRSVALFELCERLSAPSRWEHLGASHLRVVLNLPSDLQEQLLSRANAERWTVKALHGVVLEHKAGQQRGVRRPGPIKRGLATMQKGLADCRRTLERGGGFLQGDVEAGLHLLEETRSFLDDLSRILESASHADDDH